MGRLLKGLLMIVSFLPVAGVIIYLSDYTWWVTALIVFVVLFITILLWTILSPASAGKPLKRTATVNLKGGQANREFYNLLALTAGTGNTILFSSRKITTGTEQIKESLLEMSSALEALSDGSVEMVGSVEEVSRQIKLIEEQMSTVVETGEELNRNAEKNLQAVEQGSEALRDSTKIMAENETTITEAGKAAEELAAYFKEIYAVITTIKGYARQTNLLALNAEIEATKAGAAGRGFSVVAEDVGKLAANSGQSAEEISRLIAEVDQLVESVREKTSYSRDSLVWNNKRTAELRSAFGEIITCAEGTSEQVTGIKTANESLFEAVGEIRSASENVFDVIQQSTASAEEISASAAGQKESINEINEASSNLTRLIETFKQNTDKYNVPKVGYINWTSEIASAHLFKHWFKRDGGGEVILVEIEGDAISEMYAALASKEFDSTVSCWTPGMHDVYVDQYPGKLDILGTNLAGAKTGLVVPDYVTIERIEELKQHRDKFGGIIYAIEKEAGISRQALDAISRYDLGFDIQYGDNSAVCEALDRAVKAGQWVVVTGWVPESMFDRWTLKFLQDPKESFGGDKFIKTVVRLGLKEDHPRLYKALQNFRWSVEDATSFMNSMNSGLSPDDAARKALDKIDARLL